jgi:hypothetical protein
LLKGGCGIKSDLKMFTYSSTLCVFIHIFLATFLLEAVWLKSAQYEYGNKVSIAATATTNIIVNVRIAPKDFLRAD